MRNGRAHGEFSHILMRSAIWINCQSDFRHNVQAKMMNVGPSVCESKDGKFPRVKRQEVGGIRPIQIVETCITRH